MRAQPRSASLLPVRSPQTAIVCRVLGDDPACARSWDQRSHCGPFQPDPSCEMQSLPEAGGMGTVRMRMVTRKLLHPSGTCVLTEQELWDGGAG